MSTVEAPEAETPAERPSSRTVEQLEALYGYPGETSLVKELDHIIPEYAAFIEASPFAALATSGPEGLDCSPRGDLPGFVRIENPRTLMMPDRRGNNRADSLKNIIRDPRVALLFLVPGSGTTLRVNGRAHISIDADALRVLHRRRQAGALGHRDRGRRGLFPVRPRHPPLGPLESGKARRSEVAADARQDPRSHQPEVDRRRDLRPRMAGARQGVDVVSSP